MKLEYIPEGTCSRRIEIEMEGDVISEIKVSGGCSGNLQGVAALCRGRRAHEVMNALTGIKCGMKPTSCPDQISRAIREHLKAESHG